MISNRLFKKKAFTPTKQKKLYHLCLKLSRLKSLFKANKFIKLKKLLKD